MALNGERIKDIYSSKVARKYDFSMPPFFLRWKRKAFEASSLKSGDRVLVFCCGSGLDFPFIQEKIGEGGGIVGVDFSTVMLEQASRKAEKSGWKNIELIEADITKPDNRLGKDFNAGVCTLGLSIIPNYMQGYRNLCTRVRPGGEIIIGDMQLASGWLGKLNPITIMMAKKFGGTREGHKNSLEIRKAMAEELSDIRTREFFLGAYYYRIGKRR